MNLGKQKALAARALGVSKKRVKFDTATPENKKSLKEIISRDDVRSLLEDKVIVKEPKKGNSRTRANHLLAQKKKGQRKGHGSRKGTANSRFNHKDKWMIKIRALRAMLKNLKDAGKLDTKTYRDLYRKCKGNFFRSKRHLGIYIEQNNLLKEVKEDGSKK
jgi:large subunit ribosomal protein L19e